MPEPYSAARGCRRRRRSRWDTTWGWRRREGGRESQQSERHPFLFRIFAGSPEFGSVCRSKEDSSAVSRARERGRGDEPDAHHPGLFFAIATMLPPRAGAVREVISDE